MLKLENISAGFKLKAIFKNVNFELLPNSKILVSGAPKTGKTTLLQTAAGFIPPISGCVFFNYMPITEYNKRFLNNKICFIKQDILPEQKLKAIKKALNSNFEYVIIDEPFAFLSSKLSAELQLMFQKYKGGLLISETSFEISDRKGFEVFRLSEHKKTALSKENAVYN